MKYIYIKNLNRDKDHRKKSNQGFSQQRFDGIAEVRCGIDRARRVLSGTSLGTVVVGLETNRSRCLFDFCLFPVFFRSILGF
jgi:hypothetical protein